MDINGCSARKATACSTSAASGSTRSSRSSSAGRIPAKYADYSSRDMTLRPDAGRYECGTLNTVGCYGQRAAIEFLLEVGIENIAPAVLSRADQLERGVRAKGIRSDG